MAFQIYTVFANGIRDRIDKADDLSDACGIALRIADDLGQRYTGGSHGPPHSVDVYTGDHLVSDPKLR